MGCHRALGATLLYIGISPKPPATNGAPPSRQRLINRVRYHFRGNAAGSTLRLTLGCLLADVIAIRLWRVGSGRRRTFAAGEQQLSNWMAENAFVCWLPMDNPWVLESLLIQQLSLPLNLQGNEAHPFHERLSAIRRKFRDQADAQPIWRQSHCTA